ncbi:glycosyltransferase [Caballeronia sp. INDeC2]|uniref:glycosyltransferase n=1 Tax=Caballeronia sp. INDeC2 TaxID=2921747 RepID=UPI0020286F17|nr:glycosyltransferase [Caballeronia sp. INDeC2]
MTSHDSHPADATEAPVLDALSPASFWWPERIVPSPWLEHAPFAFWLVDALRPSLIVEAGATEGFLFSAMCQAVTQLALDTRCIAFATEDANPGADTAISDHEIYQTRRYQAFSCVVRPAGRQAAVEDIPDGSIDVLVLLGEPSAQQSASMQLASWLPKLSARAIVLVRADAVSTSFPSLIFPHGGGLGVLIAGSHAPLALRALAGLPERARQDVCTRYARLGTAITASESLTGVRKALEAQIAALNAEHERAEALGQRLRSAEASLQEHEAQFALLLGADDWQRSVVDEANLRADYAEKELADLRASTSWRVTAPLRQAVGRTAGLRRFVARSRQLSALVRTSIRADGALVTARKAVFAVRNRGLRGLVHGGLSPARAPRLVLPPPTPALEQLALRVLIVAETSIRQCMKYRVTQKQQMFAELGIDCTVLSWRERAAVRQALPTHSVAIFYRVPGFPENLDVIEEAKALGIVTLWEVDDLIFDRSKYALNTNLDELSQSLQRELLAGVDLYRAALLACDRAIASTTGLADAMRDVGMKHVEVVENALDRETMRVAASLKLQAKKRERAMLRIVYGSGTKTHDSDFRVAAPAIKRVLRARSHVRLRVIGELNLPADFADVASQIERQSSSNYPTYLGRLAECDISIAPLEESVFNDAKSNIKYLEASVVRLPSVCSPAAAFRSAIVSGDTAFLAETDADWERMLLQLVDDSALRAEMAARAYHSVMRDYSPHAIATRQLAPVVAPFKRERGGMRVLGVNIYYEPRSFGGATIIAEEMARRLSVPGESEYFMFTSLPTSEVEPYHLVRYEASTGGVFALGLPGEHDPAFEFENPHVIGPFTDVVRAVRPDVVHLHSLQGIGAQIAEICEEEGIPVVVTLHDAWWICGRQFMITGEHRYCHQRKIDLTVCASCVNNPTLNSYRQFRLHEILASADKLLAPSAFFRDLYIENGFDAAKVVVNKNGIRPPALRRPRASLRERPLRFGYVSGETPIKGSHLIRKALNVLPYDNYELRVVDNGLNLGLRTIDAGVWSVPGRLEVVPAYTQQTIDTFFQEIDVLLFPTQWKESFGLSVREALIRDVWVIATDAGGVIEDIVDGENGDVIALDDDGTQLAAAIGGLLADPQKLDGYRNPYASSIRVFDDQARELRAILEDVVTKHVASSAVEAAR